MYNMSQCEGTTKNGHRCKRRCTEGRKTCHVHYGDSCPICMNTMTQGTTRKLECTHEFHTACLDRWRRRNSTCPMCRVPFDQPRFRVKINIEPDGFEHEAVTSNVQSLVDMFGLEMNNIDRFFSTISFQVMNSTDMRNVLDEIGLVPTSMYLPSFNTEG
jgi:hypothetical protein